ncbi:hypothetical protein CHGG_02656 [Chaetomium globosum CBS 148.51]|uniref:Delta(24(24(1)))-sterol reductase n=1 Tax=Chaetomium globosum (strain ATCC 6205 / CBS 148.51 / DSM 1962 / NBRC 6347 / NRRL 1970) TaxID=306901 RepID=Q2HAU8_CHAGB|nr:uncharacterized protein CHGG_02656 [Chaetomium globosum CBS 148.51]EAQ90721.1 hypothetical protein CHGG_02656 [Chaetomium globosum CBS 148.51]
MSARYSLRQTPRKKELFDGMVETPARRNTRRKTPLATTEDEAESTPPPEVMESKPLRRRTAPKFTEHIDELTPPETPIDSDSAETSFSKANDKEANGAAVEPKKRISDADFSGEYEFGGPWFVSLMMVGFPILMWYMWIGATYYDGGFPVRTTGQSWGDFASHLVNLVYTGAFPHTKAWMIYWIFFIVEGAFYCLMPGIWAYGKPLEHMGGKQLKYYCSAYTSWYATLTIVGGLHFSGVFPLYTIIDEFGPLLSVSILSGWLVAIVAYVSALARGAQHRMSGNNVYDFFMGAELNPRMFGILDFKMFFEVRMPWSASLMLAHFLYGNAHGQRARELIVTTWDMYYEKWGFMLIFWNLSGVPLSNRWALAALYVSYVFVYWIWDSANSQKNRFRSMERGTLVKRNTFPQVPWQTLYNPKTIETGLGDKILADGWYGMARKVHYTCDVYFATTWGLITGFNSPFPWFYPVFFTVMIAHRAWRDIARCREKYGAAWTQYEKQVPYLFIPLVPLNELPNTPRAQEQRCTTVPRDKDVITSAVRLLPLSPRIRTQRRGNRHVQQASSEPPPGPRSPRTGRGLLVVVEAEVVWKSFSVRSFLVFWQGDRGTGLFLMWGRHRLLGGMGVISAQSLSPSIQGLSDTLSHEIDGFNAFSARQTAVIHLRIADLEDRYGVSITTSEPPASELCQVVVPELEDLQASLGDIQTAILQLDWYNRVNQEAIQRLKYKQELVAGRPPLHSRSSTVDAARLWGSEPLASLNQFRVTVRTALTAGGPARHTSLLSRRWLHKRGLGIPDAARRAVATDDSAALDHLLHQVCSEKDRTLLARALLQLAAVYSAPRCCALLTPLSAGRLAHVKEDADFLHHVIIQMGRQRDADSSQGLDQILRVLPESERWVLLHADALGRLGLHYAAVYGLAGVCRHILSCMAEWGWSTRRRHQAIFTCDAAGETPLDLAVDRGHAAVVRALLEALGGDVVENEHEEEAMPQHLSSGRMPLGRLLLTAIQAGFEDVFSALLSAGLGLQDFRNGNGETAMYVAARHGRVGMVRALLLAAVDPNLAETVRGWTPLMIAAIQGHQEALELLVNAAVDQDARDHDRGWTALDHAAYKGYPAMMKMLRRQP